MKVKILLTGTIFTAVVLAMAVAGLFTTDTTYGKDSGGRVRLFVDFDDTGFFTAAVFTPAADEFFLGEGQFRNRPDRDRRRLLGEVLVGTSTASLITALTDAGHVCGAVVDLGDEFFQECSMFGPYTQISAPGDPTVGVGITRGGGIGLCLPTVLAGCILDPSDPDNQFDQIGIEAEEEADLATATCGEAGIVLRTREGEGDTVPVVAVGDTMTIVVIGGLDDGLVLYTGDFLPDGDEPEGPETALPAGCDP
jgi:hypothetical protein